MEREVLSPHGLSWGGFTIMFVLWVWGDQETGELAEACGLAKGTLSGMLRTLERSDLVSRVPHDSDRRRVVVRLQRRGLETIESVFPEFNKREARFTERLQPDERRELARLLRLVTATADDLPLLAD